MKLRHYIRRLLGHRVVCQTHYGTFDGVVVHCTKYHVVLAPAHPQAMMSAPYGPYDPLRQYPPMGPGGPYGPGGGGGWNVAIPLAAIIGITALGLHWW